MDLKDFLNRLLSKENLKYLNKKVSYEILLDILDDKDIKKLERIEKNSLEFKELLKKYRKIFREIFSVYFLKRIDKIEKIEDPIEILKTSYPTLERLPFYEKIYNKIIKKKSCILDLASGLNPISTIFIKDKIKFYLAVDISEKICQILNKFFQKNNINGECIILNILRLEDNWKIIKKKMEKIDYVFIWKTIPLIEKIKKGYTKKLLGIIDSNFIVLSFSMKRLGSRKYIGRAWISWIKRIVKNSFWEIYDEFKIPNEYFLVLKKKT